jgi:hypothetical protein
MQNMKCPACVLKHLSAAISYAKEVQSGHNRRHELDHRPDLLGELVNAEHHLKLLDNNICGSVSTLRKKLQDNGINPGLAEIEYIRSLWKMVENKFMPVPASGETKDLNNIPDVTAAKTSGCAPCGKKKRPAVIAELATADIIIPLKVEDSKADNLELRYALRSIEKYMQGSGRIIIVCPNPPEWLRNVTLVKSVPNEGLRKAVSIYRNLRAGMQESTAEKVIWWLDDNVILRPMSPNMFGLWWSGFDMTDYKGGSFWHRILRNTASALQKRGYETRNCESHVPMLFDREKFLALDSEFGSEFQDDLGLVSYSVYCNRYNVKSIGGMQSVKATFERDPGTSEDIEKAIADKFFVGYDDKGFTGSFREWLGRRFTHKSRFEV